MANMQSHDWLAIFPLDAPETFAGGDVVAAIRLPVDVSTLPQRHVITVKRVRNGQQSYSTHEVAHDHVQWVGGQGHYDMTWQQAIEDMARRAIASA
jgi:hypothetical protein